MTSTVLSRIYGTNAKLLIFPTYTQVNDDDGTMHILNYGNDDYQITLLDICITIFCAIFHHASKPSKPSKRKKLIGKRVTVVKRPPRCPITNEILTLETTFEFQKFYALNTGFIRLQQHHQYNLKEVYGTRIAVNDGLLVLAVVKVVDGRKMNEQMKTKLESMLPFDIVQMISKTYAELQINLEQNYDFHMVPNLIKLGKKYHRSAIAQLVANGTLELAVLDLKMLQNTNERPSKKTIMMLNESTYNYKWPHPHENEISPLQTLYLNCPRMLNFRKFYIRKYLTNMS